MDDSQTPVFIRSAIPRETTASQQRKHLLHGPWQYSVHLASNGKQQRKWIEARKVLSEFHWVEDFWALQQRLVVPSQLVAGVTLYLFRVGAEPSWEAYPDGGAWSTMCKRGDIADVALDQTWEALQLAAIGEMLCEDPNEIVGISIGLRHSYAKFSLWTREASEEKTQRIIATNVIELLPSPSSSFLWSYMPHITKRRNAKETLERVPSSGCQQQSAKGDGDGHETRSGPQPLYTMALCTTGSGTAPPLLQQLVAPDVDTTDWAHHTLPSQAQLNASVHASAKHVELS